MDRLDSCIQISTSIPPPQHPPSSLVQPPRRISPLTSFTEGNTFGEKNDSLEAREGNRESGGEREDGEGELEREEEESERWGRR